MRRNILGLNAFHREGPSAQSRNQNSEYLAQRRKTRSLDGVKRNPGNPPRIPLSFRPGYLLGVLRASAVSFRLERLQQLERLERAPRSTRRVCREPGDGAPQSFLYRHFWLVS
jgi:hypothetical protein